MNHVYIYIYYTYISITRGYQFAQAALLCNVQLRLENRITSVRAKVPKMMLAAAGDGWEAPWPTAWVHGPSMVNPPSHLFYGLNKANREKT